MYDFINAVQAVSQKLSSSARGTLGTLLTGGSTSVLSAESALDELSALLHNTEDGSQRHFIEDTLTRFTLKRLR